MTTTLYLTYVVTVLIVMMTPGPATILAFSHGLQHGGQRTLATIAGDLIANQIQMLVAVTGLGLLLAASSTAFMFLKFVGVLYLIYLAVKTLRATPIALERGTSKTPSLTLFRHFKQGFAVSITSPKAIAFYGALFPQFVDPTLDMLPQFVLLAVTAAAIDFVCLCAFAFGAEKIGTKLLSRFGDKGVNRISGGAMLMAASFLLLVNTQEAKPINE